MPLDLDREFFNVRVFAPEQTTGDDSVTFRDEAPPCGCALCDGFACVWVRERHYSWLCMYEFQSFEARKYFRQTLLTSVFTSMCFL